MSNSQRTLAILVGLGLAFAMGITFDGLFGEAYVPGICPPQDVACATIMSAEATRTIAIWTRFDTLLSMFTGAAAIFAFLAYRAAREQADTAKHDLEHRRDHDNREYLLQVARDRRAAAVKRGRPSFSNPSVRAAMENGHLWFTMRYYVTNIGESMMLDCSASGKAKIVRGPGSEPIAISTRYWPHESNRTEVVPGGTAAIEFTISMGTVSAQMMDEMGELFSVEFDLVQSWRDVSGFSLQQLMGAQTVMSSQTPRGELNLSRGALIVSDGLDSWVE